MKKAMTIFAIMLLASPTAKPSDNPAGQQTSTQAAMPAAKRPTGIAIAVRGQYFNPSEAAFKDVYGGGFAFGGEVTVRLWKGLTAWLGGSTFSKSGKLTYTGETTKVRITPIGWGLEYGIARGRFGAYAGAGLSYYQFRETNFIGDVSSGGLGWNARSGVTFRFAKKLFADARLVFSRCQIDPSGIKVNIGGLELGAGLGYKF